MEMSFDVLEDVVYCMLFLLGCVVSRIHMCDMHTCGIPRSCA